jgi:ketosteroid isomerase-like protein
MNPITVEARVDSDPQMRTTQTANHVRASTARGDGKEVAARLFDAFNNRDQDAVLEMVHSDIVFEPVSAAVMSGGEPYRGHDGIRRYVSDVETYWDELTVRPVQIRAAGQVVVALGMTSGRGMMGSFKDAPTTWVLKFKEGLVIHAQVFSDERNVHDALGR